MSPTVGSAYTASSRVPLIKAFRIVALFEAGFDQYDAKLIYTDLYAAQEFYEYGDSVTGVEMRIADISKSGAIKQEIERRLNNSIYHTMDWAELNHGLFSTIQMQQLLLSVPFQGLMVISGFVVVATLTMLGLEKRQEIALLKAIGATNSAIFRIFLLQGMFYGVAGASLGLGLAYLLCRVILVRAVPLDPKIYFISQLPIRVDAVEFAGVAVAAIAVCVTASIIPALSTALRRPTDGLRAE
jgi:lipoprotein-releasing system permease protein